MLYNATHSAPPAVNERSADTLEQAVLELKVIARQLKEGLNLPDEPDVVREDVQNEAG